jgi:hypothetical protein
LVEGAFVGIAGFLFGVVFFFYPQKIVSRVTSRTQAKAVSSGDAKSAERGRLITNWGIRVYIVSMIALEVHSLVLKNGRNWGWSVLLTLFTLWFFSMIKNGMKRAKDVMAFLLLLGGLLIFHRWQWVAEYPYMKYSIAHLAYGAVLGAVLLFSKDVNYYLALRYEKLPKGVRAKVEKKEKHPTKQPTQSVEGTSRPPEESNRIVALHMGHPSGFKGEPCFVTKCPMCLKEVTFCLLCRSLNDPIENLIVGVICDDCNFEVMSDDKEETQKLIEASAMFQQLEKEEINETQYKQELGALECRTLSKIQDEARRGTVLTAVRRVLCR